VKREHKTRDGQPFTIYALMCPHTMQVRYVGQTSGELKARTKDHSPSHFHGEMRDWLEALLPEHPVPIVLEIGTNRLVKLKSGWRKENKGNGTMRAARIGVWYSTVRETVWQKRFRRTLLNETPLESLEVAALLCNPVLPWETASQSQKANDVPGGVTSLKQCP
jgi:hypothetical protein